MKKCFVLCFMILALIVSSFTLASCTVGGNTGSGSHGGNSFSESNFDNESPKESVSQSEKPAESVKESAKESVKESTPAEEGYTITFDSAGGTSVPSQKVLNGKKIKKPAAPTKVGYTFTGWFVADDEWNFLAYTVTDDMTLTAGWAANTYVISFDVDGGKAVADMNVTYESSFVLPVPEKENYVFLGWELGGKTFESGVYAKTENITLTAKWGVAVSTITFDAAGGSAVSPMKVNYGESYVLPKSQKSGYVFAGWIYNGEIFKDGTILSDDITLVARWEGLNDIFKFESSEEGITITEYVGNATDVIVPAEINNQPVIAVKEGVFANNSSITSVVFDGTFENYTEKMFAGCSSLKSLTISGVFDKALWWLFGDGVSSVPASFTEISFALNSNYTDGYMFKGGNENNRLCEHAITYVIPYGATKIYDNQFSSWQSLQSVYIPDSVTSIGVEAFSGCSGLTSITIPSSVTTIGSQAFSGCSNLTSVVIPNSVTTIGSQAFSGCSSLTSVVIPNSVTSIGYWAFEYCSSLMRVTIQSGVASIGYGVFSNCYSLASIEIPGSMTSIGDSAFSDCSSLTCVVIQNSVTGIGEHAFYGCKSLTSVTIPSSVTKIGWCAFYECSRLTNVTFNGTVEEWKNVEKGSSWLRDTKVTVIKCSDGDINL